MSKGFFITGTDTGIGKTFFAVKLLNDLHTKGFSTAGLKPIASGSDDDGLALQQASTLKLAYNHINPFNFHEPIAPHIAAAKAQQLLSVVSLIKACEPVLNSEADYIIIEGAGGWQVPLNENETLADFAKALNFPVILVVGIKLGCLNHALLTWESLQNSGVQIAGWVANQIDPTMQYIEENIATLKQRLPLPLLEVIPFKEGRANTNFTSPLVGEVDQAQLRRVRG